MTNIQQADLSAVGHDVKILYAGDPVAGSKLLHESRLIAIDAVIPHLVFFQLHPFELPIQPGKRKQIAFTAGGNIYSEENNQPSAVIKHFLALINFLIELDHVPLGLRVIYTPVKEGRAERNIVFFELETDQGIVLSGESTDISGFGIDDMKAMMDVFAYLAETHKVEIKNIFSQKRVNLNHLYGKKVVEEE